MIKAIKDYKEDVWKPSWNWVKKHPIAYVIISVLVAVISFVSAYIAGWIKYC